MTVMARRVAAGTLLALLAVLQACTVTPLYADRSASGAKRDTAALQQIAVKPAKSREELEVRKQLIFLLDNGSPEPSKPAYSLDLGITTRTVAAATQQAPFDPKNNVGLPTAGTVIMTSQYVLSDASTGKTVASGTRTVTSDFDQPRQEFANMRAQRDAQNRAARELAELLRLSLVGDLAAN
jgi:LPS-assembly lipoprotein